MSLRRSSFRHRMGDRLGAVDVAGCAGDGCDGPQGLGAVPTIADGAGRGYGTVHLPARAMVTAEMTAS